MTATGDECIPVKALVTYVNLLRHNFDLCIFEPWSLKGRSFEIEKSHLLNRNDFIAIREGIVVQAELKKSSPSSRCESLINVIPISCWNYRARLDKNLTVLEDGPLTLYMGNGYIPQLRIHIQFTTYDGALPADFTATMSWTRLFKFFKAKCRDQPAELPKADDVKRRFKGESLDAMIESVSENEVTLRVTQSGKNEVVQMKDVVTQSLCPYFPCLNSSDFASSSTSSVTSPMTHLDKMTNIFYVNQSVKIMYGDWRVFLIYDIGQPRSIVPDDSDGSEFSAFSETEWNQHTNKGTTREIPSIEEIKDEDDEGIEDKTLSHQTRSASTPFSVDGVSPTDDCKDHQTQCISSSSHKHHDVQIPHHQSVTRSCCGKTCKTRCHYPGCCQCISPIQAEQSFNCHLTWGSTIRPYSPCLETPIPNMASRLHSCPMILQSISPNSIVMPASYTPPPVCYPNSYCSQSGMSCCWNGQTPAP